MIMILSKSKYHNMAVTYRVPHKMPQMLASETNLNKYNVICLLYTSDAADD